MKFQNYTLQREVGRGGMATVHLAEDHKFDTTVAIKILNKEFLFNDNIRKRFLSEAKSLFKISHPGVIKVTDLIEQDDLVAFVMEYIEGETLKEYIERRGKLSDDEISAIFSQILDAVGHIHDSGLVHRDIKPSNFMIDKRGKIKIMDFGIAKNMNSTSAEYTSTLTAQQMGTPMYMSPEQVKSSKEVTFKSDIYSLGVVLWQMTSGQRPYNAETLSNFEIQLKIFQEKLPHLNSVWDAFIEKATQKNEMDRYDNCVEWLRLIGSVAAPGFSIKNPEETVFYKPNEENNSLQKENLSVDSLDTIFLEGSIKDTDNELLYGFVGVDGNWLIQPKFNKVYSFDDKGFCFVKYKNKWGYIKKNGEFTIQPNYDVLYSFDDEGYCNACINGKWGWLNRQGQWIIQPNFDQVNSFNEDGYCIVEINNKYGVIDRQGSWILQNKYDSISYDFIGSLFSVQINEKWGWLNANGNWLIQPMFDTVEPFDDKGNISKVRIGEKIGFIDMRGNWVIQPKFDSSHLFDESGYCAAAIGDKWGFIDLSGKWIIQPVYDDVSNFTNDSIAYVEFNEKVGYINRNGDWVLQPIYESIFLDQEEKLFTAEQNNRYGKVDFSGNWIIHPKYDALGNYEKYGYYSAQLNGKWGWINKTGNWAIQPMFDTVYSFDENGHARVELNQRWGIIDKKGMYVLSPTYFLLEAVDKTPYYKASQNNLYGYIDINGNWLIPPQFDYFMIADIWDDEKMVWNDVLQIWEEVKEELSPAQLNFDNENSALPLYFDNEDFESFFGHLRKNSSTYLFSEVPQKKINNFSIHFNKNIFSEVEFLVYYDETLFGKGDDGYVLFSDNYNWYYLLISKYLGIKIAMCLEDDEASTYLTAAEYVNGKGVILTCLTQENEEQVHEVGFQNDAGIALVKFLNEKVFDI